MCGCREGGLCSTLQYLTSNDASYCVYVDTHNKWHLKPATPGAVFVFGTTLEMRRVPWISNVNSPACSLTLAPFLLSAS